MKKHLLIFTIILLFFQYSNAQWTVENLPDPKSQGTEFYVCNPDSILSQFTVDTLNKLIMNADDSEYVQIAVVAVNSIGDKVPKTFATNLFNYWRIGKADSDNGLLILLVVDQHRIEFETGYGIEDVLTDAECYIIQQDYMLPYFKQNDYDTGILAGVQISIVKLSEADYTQQYTSPTDNYDDYTNDNPTTIFQDFYHLFFETQIGQSYTLVIFLIFVIFLILLSSTIFMKDMYKKHQIMRFFTSPYILIAFPFPFLFILIFLNYIMNKWRNTPRLSLSGVPMHKLNEVEDNEFLKKGQITEENIRSIDYDVWITDDKKEILVLAYKRYWTKYSQCPKCKYKTYYLEYDKVITPATYSSSGTGEKKHSCKNCGHSVISRYVIPKKQKSSTSSSSYSSWSSGGGSSFSSGGSSWGGGSSGGGGAGSSW